MFKPSSNLIRQASQRGASRLLVSAPSGRPLSTSTIRLEEQAEGQEDSRQSRMASLLLEIPPEFKIQNLGPKEPRQSKKPQGDRSQKHFANTTQSTRKPWTAPMQASDAYAALQGLSFPPRQTRTTDASRSQNAHGNDRKPREGNGQRPERRGQGGPRTSGSGGSRDDRRPRQNDRDGHVRAESSRSASMPRAPRGDGADSSSSRTLPQPRQPKPEPVVRAAPTAQELFGESSMLDGQSNVGSEVFENLDLSDEAAMDKNVPKASNLDLLPSPPVLPHSLDASTPRKQINQFAVLQADYVLSRNPNVTLDQRGQAIGMVKQRLGA